MNHVRPWKSVVTRSVVALVAGWLMLSFCLVVLEVGATRTRLRESLTAEVFAGVRSLQTALRRQLDSPDPVMLRSELILFSTNDAIRGVQLEGIDIAAIRDGNWPASTEQPMREWSLAEADVIEEPMVALDRFTRVTAPFLHEGQLYTVEVLVDGPSVLKWKLHATLRHLALQWAVVGLIVLLGLFNLRRWLSDPLQELLEYLEEEAGPPTFRELATRNETEFGSLADAIAARLDRIETMTNRLTERERTFEGLYRDSAIGLLSLDPAGCITDANRRAVELLDAGSQADLIGRQVVELFMEEDRPRFDQLLHELTQQPHASRELRVGQEQHSRHLTVDASAVRDLNGTPLAFRLTLTDVSRLRRMHDQVQRSSQLLNLVIDHMSDAILLVDAEDRIAAVNQQMAHLLRRHPGALIGSGYDVDSFWDGLGIRDRGRLLEYLRLFEADVRRPVQERFEAADGVYMFQCVPVNDAAEQFVGRLWIVQECARAEDSQRQLSQQNQRMRVLREFSHHITRVESVDDLMARVCDQLIQWFHVDAVGIAARSNEPGQRTRSMVRRRGQKMGVKVQRELVDAVDASLMPLVLDHDNFSHWPELPVGTRWGAALQRARLTSLVAGPLTGTGAGNCQGVLWIAQRAHESIDRHHIMMLETLAPLISARLELAHLIERLGTLDLVDPVTGLPNRTQLDRAAGLLARQPASQWAVLALRFEGFDAARQKHGEAAATHATRHAAALIGRYCRKSCFLTRLDDDCFAVLVPGLEQAYTGDLAARLRQAVGDQPIDCGQGRDANLTVGIGVASCPDDGDDPDALISLAQNRAALAMTSEDGIVTTGGMTGRRAG